MGITGKGQSAIKAKGEIRAKFLLNTHVEANGELIVEDSIVNSKVFSNKKVSVTGKHGKIMGGETTALVAIDVNTAGTDKDIPTLLTVGKDLELEKELEVVKLEMAKKKIELTIIINKLGSMFGPSLLEDPKKYIQNCPPAKKKVCIDNLTEESSIQKEYKELENRIKTIEAKFVLTEEPYIMIRDMIYPGSVLVIKNETMKVEKLLAKSKFSISKETNTIVQGDLPSSLK
jgi:uncharacterized protein (DUF342 family)